ncbi:MAG: hypothetical protein WAP37_08550 [Solirubrobacterales bacterium]
MIFVAVCLAILTSPATAATADAAVFKPRDPDALLNAQVDNGAIFWFERTRVSQKATGGGHIYRRALASNSVELIFSSSESYSITGFKVGGGRVVIGQKHSKNLSSRVVELQPQTPAWRPVSLLSRDGAQDGDTCLSTARLIAISAAGEVIAEDRSYIGRAGNCTLQRAHSQLIAIAADGTTRDLLSRVGAWSAGQRSGSIAELTPGTGDWMRALEGDPLSGSSLATLNPFTGESAFTLDAPGADGDVEIGPDGRMLLPGPHYDDYYGPSDSGGSTLLTDPRDLSKSVNLRRNGFTSYFHLCGEKLIEISLRGGRSGYAYPPARPGRRESRAQSRKRIRANARHENKRTWSISIRNADGTLEARLPTRLKRGTAFETCDAGTAFFHRAIPKGKGKIRQFPVPLSASAPT